MSRRAVANTRASLVKSFRRTLLYSSTAPIIIPALFAGALSDLSSGKWLKKRHNLNPKVQTGGQEKAEARNEGGHHSREQGVRKLELHT